MKNTFNDSKYTKVYYQIIERRIGKHLSKRLTHNHHIIPKSLGGSDNKENLIRLSYREHYVCHHLLTKMMKNKNDYHRMACAFHYMMYAKNMDKVYTSRQFDIAVKIMTEAKRGRSSPGLGVTKESYVGSALSKWNGSKEQSDFLKQLYTNRKITWGDKISKSRIGKGCGQRNAMSSPIHRAAVSASKVGLRSLYKSGFGKKMAIPNSDKWISLISDGYSRVHK